MGWRRGWTSTRGRSVEAECNECDRLDSESTRHRVREHVKNTGHTARVVIKDVTVYRPEV